MHTRMTPNAPGRRCPLRSQIWGSKMYRLRKQHAGSLEERCDKAIPGICILDTLVLYCTFIQRCNLCLLGSSTILVESLGKYRWPIMLKLYVPGYICRRNHAMSFKRFIEELTLPLDEVCCGALDVTRVDCHRTFQHLRMDSGEISTCVECVWSQETMFPLHTGIHWLPLRTLNISYIQLHSVLTLKRPCTSQWTLSVGKTMSVSFEGRWGQYVLRCSSAFACDGAISVFGNGLADLWGASTIKGNQ
jgi:hypothetical protein